MPSLIGAVRTTTRSRVQIQLTQDVVYEYEEILGERSGEPCISWNNSVNGLSAEQIKELRDACDALNRTFLPSEGGDPDAPESAPSKRVYLLHGKGGSSNGTVRKLQEVLEERWSGVEFIRPAMPHSDPGVAAEESVEFLRRMDVPGGSLLMGISLGGLVAAKVQELDREDLQVIAISSPTWADGVKLERPADKRVAFYSSCDAVIAGRVEQWPKLASFSRDFSWLTHDTDQHLDLLTRLVLAYCWECKA